MLLCCFYFFFSLILRACSFAYIIKFGAFLIDIKIPAYVFSCRYEVAPQTRLIDESRVDEAILSMVRCLYFGETFLGDGRYFLCNM